MNASHMLVFAFPLVLFLGCVFPKGAVFDKGTTLEQLGRVIIDETKEDVERIEAASNYCSVVRHCFGEKQIVPKEVVLKSFQVDKWKENVFAYGFRLKSNRQADFPYNSCVVLCYFDDDEVYAIDFDLGVE